MMISQVLYLELSQTTRSIIRSIQLKELDNNSLHAKLKNFANIRALCCARKFSKRRKLALDELDCF